tara:strand:+ start:165 stop:557 length:393 start_codon:yes stop_codon:yes gene_type:complete
MKQYCPTCGAGTEYSLKKPQFCGSCGGSFNSIGESKAKAVFVTKPTQKPVPVEIQEEEEYFEEPNISKLDFHLEGSSSMNSYKIQDIVGSNPNTLNDGYQREVDPSYSKETITQDFLKDAGSSRRDNAET